MLSKCWQTKLNSLQHPYSSVFKKNVCASSSQNKGKQATHKLSRELLKGSHQNKTTLNFDCWGSTSLVLLSFDKGC